MKTVNQKTRDEVLERDNHTCQLGLLFGIARLSGAECTDRLEVHHKHYDTYGSEITEDLITVCSRCHDIITGYVRGLRFGLRADYSVEPEHESEVGVRHQEKHDEQHYVPHEGNSAAVDAQQQIGRSPRYIHQEDQGYIGEGEA